MKIDPLAFPAHIRRLEVLSIQDDGANTLCVTTAHCHAGPPEATIVGMASPIIWDENSDIWRFTWRKYVSVMILNESYSVGDPSEPPPQQRLRKANHEPFLPFSRKVTWANDAYPGPLALWELGSLNHIVQVVTSTPPEVERMTMSQLKSLG
jgi:hypothetical protein